MLRAITLLLLLASIATAQVLYTIGVDDRLRRINPTTATSFPPSLVVGASGTGFNAAAQDPTTDFVYVVEGGPTSLNRTLGLLEVDTVRHRVIGPTGLALSSLAFDAAGNLFGLEGRVNGGLGNLYAIDKRTGASSFLINIGLAGNFGSSLTYEPVTGKLIAYVGCPPSAGVSIDPATLAVTPLGAVPSTSLEIQGGTPSQAGDMIVNDRANGLFRITSAGSTTFIGTMDHAQRAIFEANDVINYPGTSEDFRSMFHVNPGSLLVPTAFTDVTALFPGDVVTFAHVSPAGLFANVGELVSLGSILAAGAEPPALFPGLHIEPSSLFLLTSSVAGYPAQLPSAGFIFGFTYPGGPLAGFSILLQGFVLTSTAANGIFASTDGVRFELF